MWQNRKVDTNSLKLASWTYSLMCFSSSTHHFLPLPGLPGARRIFRGCVGLVLKKKILPVCRYLHKHRHSSKPFAKKHPQLIYFLHRCSLKSKHCLFVPESSIKQEPAYSVSQDVPTGPLTSKSPALWAYHILPRLWVPEALTGSLCQVRTWEQTMWAFWWKAIHTYFMRFKISNVTYFFAAKLYSLK